MRRRLVWDIAILGLSKAIPGIIGVLSVPIFLRVAGGEAYASYGQGWAIAAAAAGIASGWLRQGELRWTSDDDRTLANIPRRTLGGIVALAGLVSLIACVAAGLELVVACAAAALAAAQSWFGMGLAFAQRRRRLLRFNVAQIGRAAIGAALAIALISLEPGVGAVGLLLALAVGYVVGGLCVPIGRMRSSGERVARQFFAYGWPLAVWLGVSMGALYMDRILLGALDPSAPLGEYVAASDVFVRGATLLGAPFVLLLHPAIMHEANSGNLSESKRIVRVSVLVGTALAFALSGMALALGAPISAILGISALSSQTFALLLFAGIMWQVALLAQKGWEVAMRTKTMLLLLLICLTAQILIMMSLIPMISTVGAAVGTAVGPALYVLLIVALDPSRRDLAAPKGLEVIKNEA